GWGWGVLTRRAPRRTAVERDLGEERSVGLASGSSDDEAPDPDERRVLDRLVEELLLLVWSARLLPVGEEHEDLLAVERRRRVEVMVTERDGADDGRQPVRSD